MVIQKFFERRQYTYFCYNYLRSFWRRLIIAAKNQRDKTIQKPDEQTLSNGNDYVIKSSEKSKFDRIAKFTATVTE